MIEKTPSVSVLMDVTAGAYLDDALTSLQRQTFGDFEIVLCAHGTDSGTTHLIREWEAKEPRLRVVWMPRLPLARAHNLAAHHARAPLLARLDADDVALPHRLEHQHRMFAEASDLAFAGSAVRLIDSRNRAMGVLVNPLTHEAIVSAVHTSSPVVHSTLMMRASAFWAVGGYRVGLNLSEDWDLVGRLSKRFPGVNCREPLVSYRVHDASLTSRQTSRLAFASLGVLAARTACGQGAAEPFLAGVPSSRRIQDTLQLSRRQLRRAVSSRCAQIRFGRALMMAPRTSRFTVRLRRAAIRAGMRPLYMTAFRLLAPLALRLDRRGLPSEK